jgi:hypothetical protein
MKNLIRFTGIVLILSLVAFLPVNVSAKQIRYQFRFLTQGANAYKPASQRKIQLIFKYLPKTTLVATTDKQGNAVFRTSRCKADDPAELVFRSDMPDKKLLRVPISTSCGTEDSPATSYNLGVFSLTYGKFLAISAEEIDGPCYSCKL